jgi:LEA14-like dessication related protein
MRRPIIPVALLTVSALAGCLAGYQQPEVRFDGIRLGGLGLRGGTVYAQLHVLNPNRFSLRTDELSYDLELAGPGDDVDWVRLAQGTFRERIEIEARDSALVEIPIEFAYADLGGAIRSILDRGTLDYRVTGRVRLTDPIDRSIPYRRTGKVTFSDAQ